MSTEQLRERITSVFESADKGDLMPLWCLIRGDGLYYIMPGTPTTHYILDLTEDNKAELVTHMPGLLGGVVEKASSVQWQRAVYSLIELCTYIKEPDKLARPLQLIYRSWKESDFGFTYHGLNIRSELRAALATNQCDRSMLPDWQAGVNGHSDYLTMNMGEALRGIVLMPCADDEVSADIGKALNVIVQHLEPHTNTRRSAFESHIEYLKKARPFFTGEVISDLAKEYKWPNWTTLSV